MAYADAHDALFSTPPGNKIEGYVPVNIVNAWRTHRNGEPSIYWRAVMSQPSMFLMQNFNPAAFMNMPLERRIRDGGQIPLFDYRRDGVNENEVHQEAVHKLLLESYAVQRSLLYRISAVAEEVRKFLNAVMTIMKERQDHIVPWARRREWDNRIPLPGSKRANVTGPVNWSMTFGFHSREVIAAMAVNADLTEYYKKDYDNFIEEQTILLESAILAGKIFYFLEFLSNFAPRFVDYVLSKLVTTTASKNAYATKNTASIFKKIEEFYLRSFAPTMSGNRGSMREILNQVNEIMKQVPERENEGFDGIFCTDAALEKLKNSGALYVIEDHDFGIVNPIYELSPADTEKGHINVSNLRGTQSLGDVNYFSNSFRCDAVNVGGKAKFICALPKTFPHLGQEKDSPLRSEERMTRYIIVHQPFKKITSQIARGLAYDEYHISTPLSKHDNLVLKMKEHLAQCGLTHRGLYDPEDYFQEVLQGRDYFKDVDYLNYRQLVLEGKMKRNHELYLYDTRHPFLQRRPSRGMTLNSSDNNENYMNLFPGSSGGTSSSSSSSSSSYLPDNTLDQFGSLTVGSSYHDQNSGYGTYGYGPSETGAVTQPGGGGDNDGGGDGGDDENNGGIAPDFRSKCPYSPLMLEGNIPLVERDDMLSKVVLFNAEVTKFEESFGNELLEFITACCSKVPSKKQVFLAIKIRDAFNDEAIGISANAWSRRKVMYLSFLIQELVSDYKSNAILTSPRIFFFAVMSIGKSSINDLRDFFASTKMEDYFERNLRQLGDMIAYYSKMACILDSAFKSIEEFITSSDNDLTIFRSFPSFSETIPMADPAEVMGTEINTDPYSQMYRVFETFLMTRTESVVMPTKVSYDGKKLPPIEHADEEEADDLLPILEPFADELDDENDLKEEDRLLLGEDETGRFEWSAIPTKDFKTDPSEPAFAPVGYFVSFKYQVGKNRRRTEILRHYRCPVAFYQTSSPRIQKLPKHLLDASKFHPLFAHSPYITTAYDAHKNSIYNLHAFCKYRDLNALAKPPFYVAWVCNLACHIKCAHDSHNWMIENGVPMFRSILILQQEKFVTSSMFAVIRDRVPRIEETPWLILQKEHDVPVMVKHHQKTLYGILDPHGVYGISNAVIEQINEPCDMRMENLKIIFDRQNVGAQDRKLLTGAVAFFIQMSDVKKITEEKLPPAGGRRTVGLFNLNKEDGLRSCDTTRIDKAVSIAPTMHPLGYQQHVLSHLERRGYYFPLGIGTKRTHYSEVPIPNTVKERYEISRDRVDLKHMAMQKNGGVEKIEAFTSIFHAFTRTLVAMNVWQVVRNSEGKEEIIWIQRDPFLPTDSGTTSDYDNKGLKLMSSRGEPFTTSVME